MSILLFLYFLKAYSCSKCGYFLADPHGFGILRFLYEKNLSFTIHGEWTYEHSLDSFEECKKYDRSWVDPQRLWISYYDPALHKITDQLQIHECQKHKGNQEGIRDFVSRVLGTCAKMTGHVLELGCRADHAKEINIVNKIIVSNEEKVSEIKTNGCSHKYPYETLWGFKFNLSKNIKFSIDLFSQKMQYESGGVIFRNKYIDIVFKIYHSFTHKFYDLYISFY